MYDLGLPIEGAKARRGTIMARREASVKMRENGSVNSSHELKLYVVEAGFHEGGRLKSTGGRSKTTRVDPAFR